MVDPVCNINQKLLVPSPSIPRLPPIPIPTDLASALRAIMALRTTIMILTNQMPGQAGQAGQPGQTGKPGKKAEGLGDFNELADRRTFTTTRIYDPNDKSVFVDVKQITGLTFFDKETSQYITWNRGASPP